MIRNIKVSDTEGNKINRQHNKATFNITELIDQLSTMLKDIDSNDSEFLVDDVITIKIYSN